MAVQNIECQIATVLMKRFLDGDNLPQNLLDDLEKHLKVCPTCQAVLNNESADIEEVLDKVTEPKGVSAWVGKLAGQPVTAGGFATAGPGAALMQASYRTQTAPAPGMAVFKNPKVLILSIALAVVLIAMSTLLKNPTQLLGSKASAGNIYTEPKEEKHETTSEEDHGTPKDEHAPADDHATDSHESEAHATEEPASDGHETDPHGETTEPAHDQPELVPDPRVPGKPTLDQSDLIVVGGKDDTRKKEETTSSKTTSTSQHQNATPAKKPATSSSSGKKTTKPATRRPAPKKSSGTKSSGGSGIKVYDENGKPIH